MTKSQTGTIMPGTTDFGNLAIDYAHILKCAAYQAAPGNCCARKSRFLPRTCFCISPVDPRISDEVRIYIVSQPRYPSRSAADLHASHRIPGRGRGVYRICTNPTNVPEDSPEALTWMRAWAEGTSRYIRTGTFDEPYVADGYVTWLKGKNRAGKFAAAGGVATALLLLLA